MANGAGLGDGDDGRGEKRRRRRSPTFSTSAAARTRERVRNCYELVVNNTGAKVFFINIFGGITRGDEVAQRHRRGAGDNDVAQSAARDSA